MNIQLVRATTADAEVMQKMQIESFSSHFECYRDIDKSPA